MFWTLEQVQGLAPDARSFDAGRRLGSAHKWASLGRSDSALWGEVKGSGQTPYRVIIDSAEPAFKCTCPSRKFPCKHGIGLAVVLAVSAHQVVQAPPPAWVADWLEARQARASVKGSRAAQRQEPVDEATRQARQRAADKRVQSREARVDEGVGDLRERLHDIVRAGLVSLDDASYSFWDEIGARMIDAQAPGLARMVRNLAGVRHTGHGWQGRLLERLASLHLLLVAYERRSQLDMLELEDVRSLIGFTVAKDDLLADEGVADRWWVVAQQTEENENLRTQRSWLFGEKTERLALVLYFAAAAQPLEISLVPGTCVDADLVFYPSKWPLRALVKVQRAASSRPGLTDSALFGTITDAATKFSDGVVAYPWLTSQPVGLRQVTPHWLDSGPDDAQCALRDLERNEVIIPRVFVDVPLLLALSGGEPLDLFGHYNADGSFLPLSCLAPDDLVRLDGDVPEEA